METSSGALGPLGTHACPLELGRWILLPFLQPKPAGPNNFFPGVSSPQSLELRRARLALVDSLHYFLFSLHNQSIQTGGTYKQCQLTATRQVPPSLPPRSPFPQSTMVRFSLLGFLALAFSGVALAAPLEIPAVGDVRARADLPYTVCSA